MPIEATKALLGVIAYSSFALKLSFDWKTDGWIGHGFTVVSAAGAAIYLVGAMYEIAKS